MIPRAHTRRNRSRVILKESRFPMNIRVRAVHDREPAGFVDRLLPNLPVDAAVIKWVNQRVPVGLAILFPVFALAIQKNARPSSSYSLIDKSTDNAGLAGSGATTDLNVM